MSFLDQTLLSLDVLRQAPPTPQSILSKLVAAMGAINVNAAKAPYSEPAWEAYTLLLTSTHIYLMPYSTVPERAGSIRQVSSTRDVWQGFIQELTSIVVEEEEEETSTPQEESSRSTRGVFAACFGQSPSAKSLPDRMTQSMPNQDSRETQGGTGGSISTSTSVRKPPNGGMVSNAKQAANAMKKLVLNTKSALYTEIRNQRMATDETEGVNEDVKTLGGSMDLLPKELIINLMELTEISLSADDPSCVDIDTLIPLPFSFTELPSEGRNVKLRCVNKEAAMKLVDEVTKAHRRVCNVVEQLQLTTFTHSQLRLHSVVCYGEGILTKLGFGAAPTPEELESADDDEDAYSCDVGSSVAVKRVAKMWMRKAFKNRKLKSKARLKRTSLVEWPAMGKTIRCTRMGHESVLAVSGFDAVCGRVRTSVSFSQLADVVKGQGRGVLELAFEPRHEDDCKYVSKVKLQVLRTEDKYAETESKRQNAILALCWTWFLLCWCLVLTTVPVSLRENISVVDAVQKQFCPSHQRMTLYRALRQLHCIVSLFPLLIVETILPLKVVQTVFLFVLTVTSTYFLCKIAMEVYTKKEHKVSFHITPTHAFHDRKAGLVPAKEERVDEQLLGYTKVIYSGDIAKAEDYAKRVMLWRHANDIDNILTRPQPQFYQIRSTLNPIILLAKNQDGIIVTITRGTNVTASVKKLHSEGISSNCIAGLHTFMSEYLYKHLNDKPHPDGQVVSILDLKGIAMKDLGGEAFKLVKLLADVNGRYPARFKEMIVANAPGWFSVIWKMTAPCLAEATRKIFRVTKSKNDLAAAIAKWLPRDQIPQEYGGELENELEGEGIVYPYCNRPLELELRALVDSLNAKKQA